MNPANVVKPFALRTFFQTILFSTLLFVIVAGFYWYSRDLNVPVVLMDYASIFVFLIAFGLLQWIVAKNTLASLLRRQHSQSTPDTKAAEAKPTAETDQRRARNREKRLFVHLFAVLQQEGRLMDFLLEDLAQFEDEQIGAAVRQVHENCKKTVDRYLSPQPIMKQAEGETVEIAAGFDQHAVKLVGNVVGQPPFTGILRHRGWQLGAISLPNLSDKDNPDLIAPAEIEIQ
jgi:hypothetical protein